MDVPFVQQYFAGHFIQRYFTDHPVEYGETALFGIGLAALVLKGLEVANQRSRLGQSLLAQTPKMTQSVGEYAGFLLERLARLPAWRQGDYYFQRLVAALEFIERTGSAQGIDDELRYLSDLDSIRQQNGHGLFRVIIWAIPILGFLGTVIGITMALNGINPEAIDQSMAELTRGLGVKFDTTALALAMSMLLMFFHFFVERAENAMLEEVDYRVAEDIRSHIPRLPVGIDGQAMAMRQIADTMTNAVEHLVERQLVQWQAAMDAAAARWSQIADVAAREIRQVVAEGLEGSLKNHAERLAAAEQMIAAQNRQSWEKVQATLAQTVSRLDTLQDGQVRQAEALSRAVSASGDVMQLQDTLNRNLAALGGAKHIEQSVHSLAAAIHMMNARLAGATVEAPSPGREPPRKTSHAA